MTREEFRSWLRTERGVHTQCPSCQGLGCRHYSSTATWRGGIGGQSLTRDLCDVCWGSGDAHEHWTDIRKLEQARKDWEKEQCLNYFAQVTGCTLSVMKDHIRAMAEILDKEERKRKIPAGFDLFWWRQSLRAVAQAFRNLTT